ncbi:hypothetical protein ASD28_24105 [Massilia sp. Root133]|nr:hypothetical protein ASD28_24105 [Massilia sp. Root133]KQZ51116.1 hypothetical protein ASD92_20875 [Massilia sp. Root1485]
MPIRRFGAFLEQLGRRAGHDLLREWGRDGGRGRRRGRSRRRSGSRSGNRSRSPDCVGHDVGHWQRRRDEKGRRREGGWGDVGGRRFGNLFFRYFLFDQGRFQGARRWRRGTARGRQQHGDQQGKMDEQHDTQRVAPFLGPQRRLPFGCGRGQTGFRC